jgi:quinol monooxygenase YgiN
VVAFQRDPNGTLDNPHSYGMDGRASGGTVDPLTSQGSLTLSADHAWLFAVNAGSGSVSVFRVNGAQLELTDRVATEGSEPNSVAQIGLLVRLEAKPGKETAVAQFLEGALPLANQESTTPVWFALRLGPSTFGIFDAFRDDAGRKAHLAGPIAAALMANATELLAQPPQIEQVDLLAVKLPT